MTWEDTLGPGVVAWETEKGELQVRNQPLQIHEALPQKKEGENGGVAQ